MIGSVVSFAWFVVELVLAFTGKVVVWAFSLGRWGSESLGENESLVFAAAGALSFLREGRRVVTITGLVLAGLAFYLLVLLLSLAFSAKA